MKYGALVVLLLVGLAMAQPQITVSHFTIFEKITYKLKEIFYGITGNIDAKLKLKEQKMSRCAEIAQQCAEAKRELVREFAAGEISRDEFEEKLDDITRKCSADLESCGVEYTEFKTICDEYPEKCQQVRTTIEQKRSEIVSKMTDLQSRVEESLSSRKGIIPLPQALITP